MTAATGEEPATDAAPAPDPVLGRIADGLALRVQGRRPDARRLLLEVWHELGAGGDPLHRCAAAHALAGVQDDPEAELEWQLQALLAADQVSGLGDPTVAPAELYPSLHLGLADVHHRLGRADRARLHVDLGRSALCLLTDAVARITLAEALDRVEARLGVSVDEPARR